MHLSRKITSSVAAVVMAAAGLAAFNPTTADAAPGNTGCENRTNNSLKKLLECVRLDGVMEHEQALQDIADANGGNRASGSAGYDASVAYVKQRMEKAGYRVTVQPFSFNAFEDLGGSELERISPNPTVYVEGTDFGATPQSEPGEVSGTVVPVDVQLGLGNASTSGCEAADYIGVTGKIALIQRGTCTFEQKGNLAGAAGAIGIIFFNQGNTSAPDRNGIPAVTLGNGYSGGIPAVSATYALGAEWANTGGPLTMRLNANVERTFTTTTIVTIIIIAVTDYSAKASTNRCGCNPPITSTKSATH